MGIWNVLGGASNDSSSSDGKNESNSESNFSSSSESKSDSASKDGDIENPDTGIGFQYGLLLVLIVSGVLIGYYIKKHNKIHKI